jgi:hypothetical protein
MFGRCVRLRPWITLGRRPTPRTGADLVTLEITPGHHIQHSLELEAKRRDSLDVKVLVQHVMTFD